MPEFSLPLSIPHNMPHPAEFWSPGFPLHSSFNPNLLHQNIMPPYKIPNFHAFLTQYMGLNNLGIFNYPQNLSMTRMTPPPNNSPRESPTHIEADKWMERIYRPRPYCNKWSRSLRLQGMIQGIKWQILVAIVALMNDLRCTIDGRQEYNENGFYLIN